MRHETYGVLTMPKASRPKKRNTAVQVPMGQMEMAWRICRGSVAVTKKKNSIYSWNTSRKAFHFWRQETRKIQARTIFCWRQARSHPQCSTVCWPKAHARQIWFSFFLSESIAPNCQSAPQPRTHLTWGDTAERLNWPCECFTEIHLENMPSEAVIIPEEQHCPRNRNSWKWLHRRWPQ